MKKQSKKDPSLPQNQVDYFYQLGDYIKKYGRDALAKYDKEALNFYDKNYKKVIVDQKRQAGEQIYSATGAEATVRAERLPFGNESGLDYEKAYIKSGKFKERLTNSKIDDTYAISTEGDNVKLYNNYKSYEKGILDRLNKTKVEEVAAHKRGSFYNRPSNKIIYSDYDFGLKGSKESTLSHEFSHVYDPTINSKQNWDDLIKNLNPNSPNISEEGLEHYSETLNLKGEKKRDIQNRLQSTFEAGRYHEETPIEKRGDIQSIRNMLYRTGIYNDLKDKTPITRDHINKLLKTNEGSTDGLFKRFQNDYDEETQIHLLNTVADNSDMKKQDKQYMNLGGLMKSIAPLAALIPGAGTAVSAGLGIAGTLLDSPSNYAPVKYNEQPVRMNQGGPIPTGADQQTSDNSFQVNYQGNATDAKSYGNINLDKNEIVDMINQFVYSDEPLLGGKSPAQLVKPLKVATGKAEKYLKTIDDSDMTAHNTINLSNIVSAKIAKEQETVKSMMNIPQSRNMQTGGPYDQNPQDSSLYLGSNLPEAVVTAPRPVRPNDLNWVNDIPTTDYNLPQASVNPNNTYDPSRPVALNDLDWTNDIQLSPARGGKLDYRDYNKRGFDLINADIASSSSISNDGFGQPIVENDPRIFRNSWTNDVPVDNAYNNMNGPLAKVDYDRNKELIARDMAASQAASYGVLRNPNSSQGIQQQQLIDEILQGGFQGGLNPAQPAASTNTTTSNSVASGSSRAKSTPVENPFGGNGDKVKAFQEEYNLHNPDAPIKVDGKYGPETDKAYKALSEVKKARTATNPLERLPTLAAKPLEIGPRKLDSQSKAAAAKKESSIKDPGLTGGDYMQLASLIPYGATLFGGPERDSANRASNFQIDSEQGRKQMRQGLTTGLAQDRGSSYNLNRANTQNLFANYLDNVGKYEADIQNRNKQLSQQTERYNLQEANRVDTQNSANRARYRDNIRGFAQTTSNLGQAFSRRSENQESVRTIGASFPDVFDFLMKDIKKTNG